MAESATPRSPRVVRQSVHEEPTAPRPPQLVDQLGLTSALGRTAGSLRLTDQSDRTFVVGKLAEMLRLVEELAQVHLGRKEDAHNGV